ncbi:IS3 family transposase [Neobacillus novalis]|uniref:IS3 family transposase n=1 Tax=Neobacillus novalis TaxID=220687 RepID=A0AA95MRG0_9BACI|nr:IS3 family transposase [Neobacillus novalis]WHY88591.1 IS3 family transposase [Neobacillus novalis]
MEHGIFSFRSYLVTGAILVVFSMDILATRTVPMIPKPNQVWTWDITWLPGPIKGPYFRLYMIDIFSRMPVGWDVWENEDAVYAEELIKKAFISEKIAGEPLVLHSDNGSPMKTATFQVLLQKLCIQKSYSRPRVSNVNPYSEAMFRTMKYRPEYPHKGFVSLDAARSWAAEFVL